MTEPTTAPTQPPPAPAPAPPSANAGWAVAALLFFWPLSFSAFTHAFNVYPLWASGNVAGAHYASDRVRRLGQLSLWISAVCCCCSPSCTPSSWWCSSPKATACSTTTVSTAAIAATNGWPPLPAGSSARRAVPPRSPDRRARPVPAAQTGCSSEAN